MFENVKKRSTKEWLTKSSSFKNFTKEEFDNQFVYGLDPIMDGLEYVECKDQCKIPKEMSGRAAKIGNDLVRSYHENCMRSAKTFNNWERQWEQHQLLEAKCHVLRVKNSINFLDQMKT